MVGRVLGRRHDVTALMLRDPRDETLPGVGWTLFEDLESGERVLFGAGGRDDVPLEEGSIIADAISSALPMRCSSLST